MFKFGESSLENRQGVKPIIIKVLDRALEITKVDFGFPEFAGLRTAEEQNKLYKEGKSQLDGYERKSYHQSGNAIDFYAFVNGKASWQPDHLAMVAAAILQAAAEFGVKASWGGLWSTNETKNGIQYGWDAGHIEFYI